MTSYDVIVIGGGHNGLTAATVLARSGRTVVILEAAEQMGGALRGGEFHPGFRADGLAHVINRLDPEVAKLIGLAEGGAKTDAMSTALLSEDAPAIILEGGYGEGLYGVSDAEAAGFQKLRHKLLFQAGLLKRFLRRPPPTIGAIGMGDLGAFAASGLGLIGRGREEARDFLRMLLMNVADVADEFLGDDRLKGLLAFDATLGVHLGPRSPTSLLGLYYRLTGEAGGVEGAQWIPPGGIGAIATAFETAAIVAGVTLRTGAAVRSVIADRGTASGVRLASGEELSAPVVISAIHPKTTLIDLVGPAELGTGIVRAAHHIRTRGNVARLDLALDRPPEFLGLGADQHRGRLVIARSIDHVETAFNPAKYGEFSTDPVMEITLPSLRDSRLAPEGAATLSALVQFAPYQLKEGWERGRPRLQAAVMAALERHAPGLSATVRGARLMVPLDIEAQYGMPGGHWHHGELQADQLFVNRPIHAASGYATPLRGLFLASAGSHPGGGISGLPGLLAAKHILSGERR